MRASYLAFLSALWFTSAQSMTLPLQQVIPYDCKNCDSLSHEPLSMSWAAENKPLVHEVKHEQTSRKYQIKTSLEQLKKGVAIHTQAPGAIIRISPVNPDSAIKPEFRIKNGSGLNLTLQDASSLFSKDKALENTVFARKTLALLQLKPELGSGEFILTSSTTPLNDENFIIHVFDKFSSTALTVETDKTRYHYGEELTATITLHDENKNCPIDLINASLVSANGEVTPLILDHVQGDVYQTHTNLVSDKNSQGENWYIEVETATLFKTQTIKRQAHSAFSYVIPSAAIREIKKQTTGSLAFSAKIEVATGSRYALQAVLYGSDAKGEIHPIQTVQSAAWLAIGEQNLDFSFDSSLKTNYKAPYYLGYIHLIDFGQLKPVFEYDKPIALTKLD